MRGQADLFLDHDAPAGLIQRPADEIVIRARHRREAFKAPDREVAARLLEATGDYRVLRRLQPRPIVLSRTPRQGEKIAVIVDTEPRAWITRRTRSSNSAWWPSPMMSKAGSAT